MEKVEAQRPAVSYLVLFHAALLVKPNGSYISEIIRSNISIQRS